MRPLVSTAALAGVVILASCGSTTREGATALHPIGDPTATTAPLPLFGSRPVQAEASSSGQPKAAAASPAARVPAPETAKLDGKPAHLGATGRGFTATELFDSGCTCFRYTGPLRPA